MFEPQIRGYTLRDEILTIRTLRIMESFHYIFWYRCIIEMLLSIPQKYTL